MGWQPIVCLTLPSQLSGFLVDGTWYGTTGTSTGTCTDWCCSRSEAKFFCKHDDDDPPKGIEVAISFISCF
jgi:hypothetical protein